MKQLLVLLVLSSIVSGCAHVYTAHQDSSHLTLCCPARVLSCDHEALIRQSAKISPYFVEVETNMVSTGYSYTANKYSAHYQRDAALCVSFIRNQTK